MEDVQIPIYEEKKVALLFIFYLLYVVMDTHYKTYFSQERRLQGSN